MRKATGEKKVARRVKGEKGSFCEQEIVARCRYAVYLGKSKGDRPLQGRLGRVLQMEVIRVRTLSG